MAGLGLNWQIGIHVAADATFEDRYQEVLATHPVPATMETDVAAVHDTAVTLITSHGIVPPMDVQLTCNWDEVNQQGYAHAQVKQSA